MLDFTSFMKASRTLSEDMDLDRAIANLIQVVGENAGADTVVFMLFEGKTLQLRAKLEGSVPQSIPSIPVEQSQAIPLSLVNAVKRLRKPLILDLARPNPSYYTSDPYLQQHQPQSVLCAPLLARSASVEDNRAQLIGILYLENKHAAGAGGSVAIVRDYLNDLAAIIKGYRAESPQPSPELAEEIEELELDFLLEDFPQTIASMQEGVKRISNISTSLRTFSRLDADRKTPLNLHDGIDSTLLILKYRLKANEQRPAIEIVKNYGEISEIECYPEPLNQVFMNLLANAIDALDESNAGKTFKDIEQEPHRITVETELSQDERKILVRIVDNGTGMPEDVQAKTFDQGFTTKDVGKGTGLGMAIAKSIIEEKHGGAIACDSEVGKGTEFVISLLLTL